MTDTKVLEQESRAHSRWLLRWNFAEGLGGWFDRFISRHAPVGYEDETGFHYGVEPTASGSYAPGGFEMEGND